MIYGNEFAEQSLSRKVVFHSATAEHKSGPASLRGPANLGLARRYFQVVARTPCIHHPTWRIWVVMIEQLWLVIHILAKALGNAKLFCKPGIALQTWLYKGSTAVTTEISIPMSPRLLM